MTWPVQNIAYDFSVGLVSQANANIFQVNPTVAAADFNISIDDGALASLTNLPAVTPAGSKLVKFSLTAAEMNGGKIVIVCSDSAGNEWADRIIEIQTTVQDFDSLSDFDETTDAVANVTLVGTTTTNTDMRGTDSAATAFDLAVVDANVDAILVDTSITIPDQITALNDISVSDILTTQMTESYAADGVAPTIEQALLLIQQTIGDFSIAGTTITVKELDGSTTAATYTLDDGTNPTSRTRTT